jgi:transcriptional regulator with XRE-family HTH domain
MSCLREDWLDVKVVPMQPINSYTAGIGKRVKDLRESLGLSQEQFASRVDCKVKMLDIIEHEGILHHGGLLPVLERIAQLADCSLDTLLFQDTGLLSVQLSELKLQALRVMSDNEMTNSLAVANDVLAQVEEEFNLAVTEGLQAGREYRNPRSILINLDEESVHEKVIKAKRRYQ